MEFADARRTVLEQGWLADEDKAFQTALLDRAVLKRFDAGSRVFHRGEYGGGIYGVAQGAFGVYVPGRVSDDVLAHVLRPGVWFGYGPVLTRRHRVLGFSAIEPSVALHVPLAAVDQLIAADPRYPFIVTKLSEYGMDIAIAIVSDLLIPNAEERIAATLLRIAPSRTGALDKPPLISGVTQAQIGEMTNTARDFVNRTLKRFEAEGWITVSYRKIAILDPSELSAFVGQEWISKSLT